MRRTVLALVLLLLAAVGVLGLARFLQTRSASHRVSRAIHRAVSRRSLAALSIGPRDSIGIRIRTFYHRRQDRPAWLSGTQPNRRAQDVLAALRAAADEGLEPSDYPIHRLADALRRVEHPTGKVSGIDSLARLDVLTTYAFLRYGHDLLAGRVDPRRLPMDWYLRPRAVDWQDELQEATEGDGVSTALGRLAPPMPEYQRLRAALSRYRTLAASGGWPRVPAGPPIGPTTRGPRVRALTERLAASGDLPRAAIGARFTPTVGVALRRFQGSVGLEPTGRAGPEEIAQLDVPVSERVRQIAINLERWRWLSRSLEPRCIVVNIPDYLMTVRDGDRVVRTIRVVVGKEYDRTPIFSDTLTYVVFQPSWNVPPSIVAELADSVRNLPGYLARNHMRVFDGQGPAAPEVDPRRVDWAAAASGTSRYSIRQDPGDGNALGHVKFVFPNRFNVYFHDTPAGHLFGRRERDFSHGCIRIEHPAELATYLLQDKPGWNAATVQAAMDSNGTRTVMVPRPIPVHILYLTAWVDESGILQFRDDIYGLDTVQNEALQRRAARRTSTALSIPTSIEGPLRAHAASARLRVAHRHAPPESRSTRSADHRRRGDDLGRDARGHA